MFIALASSELSLETGTTTAPAPPVLKVDAELTADADFGPILRGAAAALGVQIDWPADDADGFRL